EECGDVSYTVPVCGLRKLNYSVTHQPKVDLCIDDGTSCTGNSLGECPDCHRAMTRCILTITNDEAQQSGLWTVGANFTLPNAAFLKDPKMVQIDPNQSYAFDFYQIYSVNPPVNSASCSLFIIKEPTVQDCHQETRTRVECGNVTQNLTKITEVCE